MVSVVVARSVLGVPIEVSASSYTFTVIGCVQFVELPEYRPSVA